MKRSGTPWHPDSRYIAIRRRRAGASPGLSAASCTLLALALSACVTPGTHSAVKQERDRLEKERADLAQQVEMLESANDWADNARVDALEALEDLRVERKRLRDEVARLEKAEAELAETREQLDARNREVERLKGTYEGLVQDLESEVSRGQIEIQQLREGLQLNVSQEILFPSGSAELNRHGEEVLRKVAGRLASLPHRVEVRGHSDNLRITGSLQKRYPSNWELAGARAARVVRLLESAGITGERLSAVSRAEFEPIAANQTPQGRSKNRRIEIRLKPADSDDVELAPTVEEPAAGATS